MTASPTLIAFSWYLSNILSFRQMLIAVVLFLGFAGQLCEYISRILHSLKAAKEDKDSYDLTLALLLKSSVCLKRINSQSEYRSAALFTKLKYNNLGYICCWEISWKWYNSNASTDLPEVLQKMSGTHSWFISQPCMKLGSVATRTPTLN